MCIRDRAVCEGVAFEHRVLIERLDGVDWSLAPILSGGVTKSSAWPQLFADVLGVDVTTPDSDELGTRGAVMLAAVATGIYPDLTAAAEAMAGLGERWEPRDEHVATLGARYESFKQQRTTALYKESEK